MWACFVWDIVFALFLKETMRLYIIDAISRSSVSPLFVSKQQREVGGEMRGCTGDCIKTGMQQCNILPGEHREKCCLESLVSIIC